MLFLCNNRHMENKKNEKVAEKTVKLKTNTPRLRTPKKQVAKRVESQEIVDGGLEALKVEESSSAAGDSKKHKKGGMGREEVVSAKSMELFINNNTQRPVSDIIFCNLIAISAIFLSLFLPLANFALPVLVFFYFEVGVAKFLLCKERGLACRYEQIFVSLAKYMKIFCLSVVKIFMALFGLILFVVPGVICLLNHCFTPFVLAENDELDVKGILMLSKELVYGFRWKIFLFAMLGLLALGASGALMFLIVLLFDAFLVVPMFVYVICIVMAVVLALIVLALPMVQIAITDYYILAKQTKIRNINANTDKV